MPLKTCIAMRHHRNPKAHDIDALIGSFRRFGFVAPPTIDESSSIMVAGHGRCEGLARMRERGEPPPAGVEATDTDWMVPVLRGIAFENNHERDAYVIADNQHVIAGGWNMQALGELLAELEPISLDGLGFDDDELNSLLGGGADSDDDDGKEVDVTGHVRQIGGHKVRPPAQMTNDDWTLHLGECLEGMKKLASNSVDAIVTDPPAGISFMGRAWDDDKGGRDKWIAWLQSVMTECHRILKPGGHALVWALPRTSHWTAMALELAGWQVRDRVSWLYVTGFPKSMNVSKAIDAHLDAHLGVDRPVVGHREDGRSDMHAGVPGSYGFKGSFDITSSGSEQAKAWEGWGTALKPACEDWWLVRKPPGRDIVFEVETQMQSAGVGTIVWR